MTIRREPTYLSTEVWRALWVLAKSMRPEDGEPGRVMTADHLADDLLRATIRDKFPQLLEHQKAVEKLEKELIKTLK